MRKNLIQTFLVLLQIWTIQAVRGRKLKGRDRDLQAVDTCNIAGLPVQDASPAPIVPCDSHSRCDFSTSKIREGFQPCCLNACVCGNTQAEFAIGVNRCARFSCSTDSECLPGRCISGACDFNNIQPLCRSDGDCGTSQQCLNGRCVCVVNGIIRPSKKGDGCNGKSVKDSGFEPPSAPSPTVPLEPTPTQPQAQPTMAPVIPDGTDAPTSEPTPEPKCTRKGGECIATFVSTLKPCCYPLECIESRCAIPEDRDRGKNRLKEFFLSAAARASRGNRRTRRLKGE